jgi:hypothetical protein
MGWLPHVPASGLASKGWPFMNGSVILRAIERKLKAIDPRAARQCGSKVPFESERLALDSAHRMHKKWKARFNAYHCAFCDSWHVGSDRLRRKAEFEKG